MKKMMSGPRHERGAVLVIAMVLLLVMSLIGLSSVVSSTLQEKMAGNAQQRSLSRYAAETALRAAEVYLATNIVSTADLIKFDGSNIGLYSQYFVPAILFTNDLARQSTKLNDVSDPDLWTAANSVVVNQLSAKVQSKSPRYVIEYVGRRSQAVSPFWSNSKSMEPDIPYLFKITAIGWARDGNVYSVLQSHFMTGKGTGVFEYES